MENCLNMPSKTQLDKFKEAAKELGCDEDDAKFNEIVKKLAKQKPDDKKETSDE